MGAASLITPAGSVTALPVAALNSRGGCGISIDANFCPGWKPLVRVPSGKALITLPWRSISTSRPSSSASAVPSALKPVARA
ncbi:hypothetical protein D9M68_826440 [compost metagenome]